jgi:hypothetical protein
MGFGFFENNFSQKPLIQTKPTLINKAPKYTQKTLERNMYNYNFSS